MTIRTPRVPEDRRATMTKTIKRLLPAALAVLLAGCAMQPVDSTTTRYRSRSIAKNNRDSEFWDASLPGRAAATEYNLQLTITAPDDEEDYAAQNQLIADALRMAHRLSFSPPLIMRPTPPPLMPPPRRA